MARRGGEEGDEKGKDIKWLQLAHGCEHFWRKKPEDVMKGAYASLYRSLSKDTEDHLSVRHFSVEGQVKFWAMRFVPGHSLVEKSATTNTIKLYVRRVFKMDTCDELSLEWLNIVVGVVDSGDLSSNTSHESCVQFKILRVMKNW